MTCLCEAAMAVGETSGQTAAAPRKVVSSRPGGKAPTEAPPTETQPLVREADPELEKLLDEEEAIAQLAELLQDKMQPDGLAIVMEADHYCMQWRGVKDMDSKMVNSIMRGAFLKNASLRREFLSLLANTRS